MGRDVREAGDWELGLASVLCSDESDGRNLSDWIFYRFFPFLEKV